MSDKNQTALETKIIIFLKKNLPRARYLHSLGVMRTVESIARRYGISVKKARLAGLLHDCSRGYSLDMISRLALRYDPRIRRDRVLSANPFLLHGFASAEIARRRFHLRDAGILRAVVYHTIAASRMSLLDKAVYLADMTAPDRRFRECKCLRRLLRHNLDAAMRAAIRIKIAHVLAHRLMLHPNVVHALNSLLGRNG